MSDELKTDKLIYRVPTFYFTIYTEVKEEPKPKKEGYIIELRGNDGVTIIQQAYLNCQIDPDA